MPVDLARRGAGKTVPSRWLKRLAQAILETLDHPEAELSVALIGDAEMRRLNGAYRKKDYPTDVLAFPVDDAPFRGAALLGDVVISVDKAREQALERGWGREEEIATLLIHGIVHLLGYDHERSPREARAMRRVEDKVRRALCERRLLRV